ncbi:MAG TPA: hypothetical protein VFD58_14515, partial [Blastocatellia bacterium]|nr:hypothetical protein [Blastocatellia bacterium]
YFHGEALEWPLLNLKGEAIESGLYAYTLSTRADTETTAHTQRGHLIIDRASSADRVWVTSSSEVGVGTASDARKVTVVGGGDATVGGAELPRERTRNSQSDPRTTDRQVDATRADGRKTQPSAVTSGVFNRIAKFDSDGETLVDSSVTETSAGDIGIGTTAPGGVLDLQRASSGDILERFWNTGSGAGAGAKLRFVAATGATSQVQLTDGAEWLMSIAGNKDIGMQFRVRNTFDTNTEAALAGAARMTIARSGNVGIGTTTPFAALEVKSITGYDAVHASGIDSFGNPTTGVRATGSNTTCSPCSSGNGVVATGGNNRSSGSFGGYGIEAYQGYGPDAAHDGESGRFHGKVLIIGNLNVTGGTKNFKIDHPLDPENKYLLHASIESSEVLNVYSGNVVTDANGEAVVTLPEWFEALNKDFRYQLTVIGTFAQAIIASEVKDHRFTIKASAPGVKVSWQVTGVRSDAVMLSNPFKAEEDKPERERGTYLSPEAFGQPEERGSDWVRSPELMRQMKERREQAQREAQPNQ